MNSFNLIRFVSAGATLLFTVADRGDNKVSVIGPEKLQKTFYQSSLETDVTFSSSENDHVVFVASNS